MLVQKKEKRIEAIQNKNFIQKHYKMSQRQAEDAAFAIGTKFMSLYCMACSRKCVDAICPSCRQRTVERATQTPKGWTVGSSAPSAPVLSQPQRTYGTFGGTKERYYTANSNNGSSSSSSSDLSWKSYSNKPSWKN